MSQAPDDEVNSRLSAAVRRHSPMPLHHQIKVAVLEGVEQGWLEPGAQLLQILGSFHQSVSRHGLNVDVKVLTSDVTRPPHVVDAALTLRGRDAWCLRRFASIDGEPLALLTAWLPPRYARCVSDQDLGTGSLYEALGRIHGVEMTAADNFVEVDRAGLEHAELLGLAPGSPVLRVIGVTRDQRDHPVEYSDVLYRPERFRFAIESRRSIAVI